jgi:hypothetical protein
VFFLNFFHCWSLLRDHGFELWTRGFEVVRRIGFMSFWPGFSARRHGMTLPEAEEPCFAARLKYLTERVN